MVEKTEFDKYLVSSDEQDLKVTRHLSFAVNQLPSARSHQITEEIKEEETPTKTNSFGNLPSRIHSPVQFQ